MAGTDGDIHGGDDGHDDDDACGCCECHKDCSHGNGHSDSDYGHHGSKRGNAGGGRVDDGDNGDDGNEDGDGHGARR